MSARRSLCVVSAIAAWMMSCGQTPGNGSDVVGSYDAVPAGSLVLTEILAHPNASRPEFIELENTSDSTINLQACELLDGGSTGHSFLINQPTEVEPGQRVLLGSAAFLGATEDELPVTVQWSDITLNQGDATESVSLNCPDGQGARHEIDTVNFAWNGMGLRRGRSWQLAVAANATSNDDPANWCEAPVQDNAAYAQVDGVVDYGSPGAPTVCETPGGAIPQVAGEVVITEILIDSFTGDVQEWFELHNPGTEAMDVRGCVIGESLIDGSSVNEHTVDYEVGSTVIPAGGYLLLSKSSTAVTSDGTVVADYPYSSLSFVNGGSQVVWIDCPSGDQLTRIDQIVFDWDDYGSNFKGYSLALSPASLSAEANDDSENWCLANDDEVYFTFSETDPDEPEPTTYLARGTPGQANSACPLPGPAPGSGELVITEILVEDFSGVSEWFEIHNPGLDEVDLAGCTMLEHEVGVACDDDSTNCRHEFNMTRGQTVVAGGAYLLLARTDAQITDDDSLLADYWYSGAIIFSNSGSQSLSIVCLDEAGAEVIVDTVTYDWADFESAADTDLKGNSLSLSFSATSASSNDLSSNWCPARTEDVYYPLSGGNEPGDDDDSSSEVEYQARGTPRTANPDCN